MPRLHAIGDQPRCDAVCARIQFAVRHLLSAANQRYRFRMRRRAGFEQIGQHFIAQQLRLVRAGEQIGMVQRSVELRRGRRGNFGKQDVGHAAGVGDRTLIAKKHAVQQFLAKQQCNVHVGFALTRSKCFLKKSSNSATKSASIWPKKQASLQVQRQH
jgi:hypothetical protein